MSIQKGFKHDRTISTNAATEGISKKENIIISENATQKNQKLIIHEVHFG